jgi:hypothetical protein
VSPPAQWDAARRTWAVLLTGIPFGVFKIGAGMIARADIHPLLGLAIALWGGVDVLLNLLSLFLPRAVSPCALSNLGRLLDGRRGGAGQREMLGLALDTLLSFTIVATVIWLRRLASLPPAVIRAWEVAVIANVMGAGLERVWQARRTALGSG